MEGKHSIEPSEVSLEPGGPGSGCSLYFGARPRPNAPGARDFRSVRAGTSGYLDALFYDLEWITFYDLEWITEGENILQSPFYGVLNACRVLMVLSDQAVVPTKEEGATWAMEHLPSEHHPIIRLALACYQSARVVKEEERRTDGHSWDREALLAFKEFCSPLGEQAFD